MYARWEFHQRQLDFRAGVIAATLANCNRDPEKRRDPYEPSDFFTLLKITEEPKPPQTADEMEQRLIGITRALGGTVKSE